LNDLSMTENGHEILMTILRGIKPFQDVQMLTTGLNQSESRDLHITLIFRRLLGEKIASVPQAYRVTFYRFVYSITCLDCLHFDTHFCRGY